ncbi:hypothetical protein G6O67_006206 [Ophiocordyceps sinensis]|uniref:Uncharacterized protein n=1 Tax=Ophiocordyceps sinensis TaxID=72228 RepID=A0A8H4LVS3_9HYPO|nr:hypothetical protein G6O67_006206 [Ophiocordyceps sinensis]
MTRRWPISAGVRVLGPTCPLARPHQGSSSGTRIVIPRSFAPGKDPSAEKGKQGPLRFHNVLPKPLRATGLGLFSAH